MAKSLDRNVILAAFRRFSEAGSIEGRVLTVRQHPELLTSEADTLLGEVEDDLRAKGLGQPAEAVARSRDFLSRCRRYGINRSAEQDKRELRFRQLVHDGTTAYQCYIEFGRTSDLNFAIHSLKEARDKCPKESLYFPSLANNLSGIYRARYDQSGDEDDLDNAIQLGEEAVKNSPPGQEKYERHINLASGLLESFVRRNRNGDLERAIDLLIPAVRALDRTGRAWPAAAHNLGGALRHRAKRDGNAKDTDEAIKLHVEAAKALPHGTAEALLYQGGLANAYWQRFTQTARLDDLEAAVTAYRIALEEAPPQSTERARLLNNLGIALSTKYEVSVDLSALDEAIDFFTQSLRVLPPPAPAACGTLANLGTYLVARYVHSGNDQDYDEGMRRLTDAETCFDGTPGLSGVLDSQAGARFARFNRAGGLADLDAAIDLWDRSLKLPSLPALELDRRRNLAAALSRRHLKSGCRSDFDRAQNLFESAAGKPSANPDTELLSALNWGQWAFERATASQDSGVSDDEAWHEAAKAFDIARSAANRLLRVQIIRQHQADWIAKTQLIPSQHAYALFKLGELERAVEALESGRTVFLTEALERNRADLERLAQIGHADLLDRYRTTVAAMQLAEREISMPGDVVGVLAHSASRIEISDRLQECISAIRKISGFEDFMRPLSLAEIKMLSTMAPLVYLLITSAGGLALIVSENGVRSVALSCNVQTLHKWLLSNSADEEPNGYLLIVITNELGLRGMLARILPEIGQRLMAPIVDALRELLNPQASQRPLVRFVPTGQLTLLPLHAASYSTKQGLASILLDEFSVTYLPSARVLRHAGRKRAASNHALMAVGDPAPLPAGLLPLRYARFEAVAVSALTPNSSAPLLGEEASAAAVRAQLTCVDTAHLACHGVFDVGSPLRSALLLAGERFTMGETIGELIAGQGPREIVLSACQTALTEIARLPEEVIGFPVGFIQAGVDTVIATLWSVNDWSTSLLMAKYVVERRQYGPAAALGRAQIWLRNSRSDELEGFAEELSRIVPPAIAESIQDHLASLTLRRRDDPPPFADPYYWAGFSCWGQG